MLGFNKRFAQETWSLYGVGMVIVILRFGARIKKLGFRSLQADDILMLNAMIWYTVLIVSVNKIIFGGSNLLTPEEEANLTPKTIRERIIGSKWVFVSEHAMVLTVWSLKLCMLFIYRRLTDGLKQRKIISLLFVWVACGFVGTELCLFLACRPFPQYWAITPSDVQCTTYQHYEITESIFNTSSDVMMLVTAIPLLLSVRLPFQQKAVLLVVFGLGIFVIVAAILTKIYCLVPNLISYVYLSWYFREASVSVYVTNLPALWSILRDVFPCIKGWGFESKKSESGRHWPSSTLNSETRMSINNFPLRPFNRLCSQGEEFAISSLSRSRERVNEIDRSMAKHTKSQAPLEIKRDITFSVEKDSADVDIEHGDLDWQKRGQTICTASG